MTQTLPPLLSPEHRTNSALLTRRAEEQGDRPLLVLGTQTYSAGDIRDRAGETAASLLEAGVTAGDRVAILCGNRIEFLDLYFACAWINAIAVPINFSSRGPQLQHILADSGARLLVVDAAASDALEVIEREGLALETIWELGAPDAQPAPDRSIGAWTIAPFPGRGGYLAPQPCRPGDIASIIYTSGTTGPSKGVCCPQAQYYWWGMHGIETLEITPDDVLLTTLPLFHSNALGTFFQALISGAKLVVLERFSASGFVPSLIAHDATVTYLLGAMVPILLARPQGADDAAHKVRRALAPGTPAAFGRQFTGRFGIALVDGYGSTETNFIIGDPAHEHIPGAMGKVREGYHACIVDHEDNLVPHGTPGELVIRSDIPFSMASGYFNRPQQTIEAWRNLWFHTGDRAWRDEHGTFYFMDRMKDAIRRRGENISAFEVEQVLLSHPAVAVAAVFPVQSELAEDEVMAALILREDAALDPVDLLDFCLPRMSYFSVPRYVLMTQDLPKTANGKIQKFRLREQGVTPETWDRESVGYVVKRPGAGAR